MLPRLAALYLIPAGEYSSGMGLSEEEREHLTRRRAARVEAREAAAKRAARREALRLLQACAEHIMIRPGSAVWCLDGESDIAVAERNGRNGSWPGGNEEVCKSWIQVICEAREALLQVATPDELDEWSSDNALWNRVHRIFGRLLRSDQMGVASREALDELIQLRIDLGPDRYEINEYFASVRAYFRSVWREASANRTGDSKEERVAEDRFEVTVSNDKRVATVRRLRGSKVIDFAEVSGSSLVLLLDVLVERQGEWLSWADVEKSFQEKRGWKGRLLGKNTLRDYCRRIKRVLADKQLGGAIHHTSDGVRFG